MKNLDRVTATREEILQRMNDAISGNDTKGFADCFGELSQLIQQNLLDEFEGMQQQQDAAILNARGVRVLTSAEQKFYNGIISAMKTEDPRQALSNTDKVLPETVIDAIFEDLRDNHPLLGAINFQNTGAMIKMLLSTTGGVAVWGALGATVTSELSANFTEIDLTMAQLTAWIPISKYMLELGPNWIDRYVRELLAEACAVQLEAGIVDGEGKDQPIGMTRALTGAVDGVYPRKTTVEVNDLSAATLGGILNVLTQGPNGKRRAVNEIILVVNPSDYFTKIFPATTPRATDGTFNHDVMPYPTKIIQSPAVPSGKAIFGVARLYFMGVGTQSGGKIEYDDSVKFLERQRAYLTVLYGYGRPMDANAFVYADITNLTDYALPVKVVNADDMIDEDALAEAVSGS